jgi:small subunit ribosomal protein S20
MAFSGTPGNPIASVAEFTPNSVAGINQPGHPCGSLLKDIWDMANTTSAKKATRKIARRTIINKSRRTQMRGAVRTVEEAIASGDRNAALKAMAQAEPELMQAAQRNIIHKNNASRKVSRLVHQIAKLAKWIDRKTIYQRRARHRRAFSFGTSFRTAYCYEDDLFFISQRCRRRVSRTVLLKRNMQENPVSCGLSCLHIKRARFWKSNCVAIARPNSRRELPCFSEQEKTRALNHLSA